jgi:hypothetical protein
MNDLQSLMHLKLQLKELETAYRIEPQDSLLTAIFQLQVAIQAVEEKINCSAA